jgi:two-component system OmpR family sensor kinase
MGAEGMFRTLYAKLAAVLLLLLGVMGGSYIALTLFTTKMYLQEVDQKLNQPLAEQLVTEKILMRGGKINEAALRDLFHMLMVINPNIEIYLLDPGGSILAFSAPPGTVKRKTVSLGPVKKFLNGSHPFPIFGDDPRDASRLKIFSAAPIPGPITPGAPPGSARPTEGYLYVILGGQAYDSAAQMLRGSYILRLSTWVAAGSVVLALLAGLFLFNLLTRRLSRLSAAMASFRTSDFTRFPDLPPAKGDHEPADEIERVESTFRQMAHRMIEQVQQLKQTDQLRRELVANVSHDLRTPLASLQGYLETLLIKEGNLSPEEQHRYLEIASRQSQRLGRLVGELFDLAKLDSRETRPHREPFSIAELVQDVLQKYRLTAENKKIRLESNLEPDLPFVSADIGLIERVLENLIQNALRYTPERGTISLALAREGDRVRVRISDSGCGIPEEDLPHIFDRFYRVEKERSGGGGLGLAIAKRILDLHGSRIAVESEPQKGTTFIFHLQTTSY